MKSAKKNSRCSCCGNAYGTNYLCKPCREDPANVDWYEGEEVSLAYVEASAASSGLLGRGPRYAPTALTMAICRALKRGLSRRAVAREVGCSWSYVQKVARTVRP
jgi:hypothetical protein